MRSLDALAWRNLTGHPLRSVLTALAIALGVGMVLAAATVGQAASQSTIELADTGPRIDLEVFSRDGGTFDRAILDTLRASPDVEHASPSLRVEVELVLPALGPQAQVSTVEGGVDPEISSLTLLGVDPEAYRALHEPELAGGTFLDGPDTIVLPVIVAIDYGLYVGDEIALQSGDNSVILTVSGRLKAETGVDALAGDAQEAFVPLEVAQTLWTSGDQKDRGGQIDRVEVSLRHGVDVEQARAEAQEAGPGLAVVRAVVAGGAMGNVLLVQAGLAVVGLIILLAAGFVILNAFAMSVTGRTREIGALRALGMTRRQVMRAVLAEASSLGLIGTVVGILAGLGLAWMVMQTMGTLGDTPLVVPWWGAILSAVMGLAVTSFAALQPAWRASRVSPIVAARPASTAAGWYVRPGGGGRVGVISLVLLLIGLAAYGLLARPNIAAALPVMVVGQAGLLGAVVLLLPALIDPVTALCRPFLVRWLGTEGRLAVDNLGRNKLRTVLTAGALTAGLTVIVATSGLMTAGLTGAVSRVRSSAGHEDVFITADLAELVSSQEMTFENFFEFLTRDDLGFDLNPVVKALDPLVESGLIEVNRYRFQIVPPELSSVPGAPGLFVDPELYLRIGNFDFFEGDPETAIEWMQRGRAMLLTPIVAERLGAQVGDDIPVQTPQGEVAFTVAGIGGGGFLMTILPYADGETYFDVTRPSFLGVVVSEGQDVEAALAQVEEAIAPFPQITQLDYRQSLDPVLELADRLELLLDGLLLLAVIVAALGVVNTMVINVTERGREIGLLRAVGATRRQVRRAVVAEAATLGLLAALVASGLGSLMLLTYGLLILPGGTASVGVRPDWETIRLTMVDGLRDLSVTAAASLLFGPLIAGLAAYYPAQQAAAMNVVEATRSERVALKPAGARRPERRRHPRLTHSPLWAMAWRNLGQHRLRTLLSGLAVALGVAMTIVGDVIGGSVLNAISDSEIAQLTGVELFKQLASLLTLAGVAVTAAAGFLVFNAFAMSVTQRRRQIGALRSLGMTRRQVLWLVLVEALITGGLGTLLGLVVGPVMGRGVIALLSTTDMFLNALTEGIVSLSSFLLAAALGMGISLMSVLLPARRATRISPLDALRAPEAAGIIQNPVKPAWVGSVVTIGLVVYLLVAPPGDWVLPPWDGLLTGLFAVAWLTGLALILPALVGGLGDLVRRPLARRLGAGGRLIADNLQRGRRRVTLTIATLVVGLTMIVGTTGFITFFLDELFGHTVRSAIQQRGWVVSSFQVTQNVADFVELDSLQLLPEAIAKVEAVVDGRGEILEFYFAVVPELSFMGSNYFSFVLDPKVLRETGDTFFTFTEGDWETAMPIMEAGCGLLLTPLVAQKNDAWLGDTLTVQGVGGDVECTIVGIGQSYVSASIISGAVANAFGATDLLSLYVSPSPDVAPSQLEADLNALADRHPGIYVMQLDDMEGIQQSAFDQVRSMLNGMLLLAIVAAAMGVINTTVMSVTERRRELGLLRAVGATRRQATAVVAGEAALMGLIGGGLGLVAGAGITVILATVYGGNGWGMPDLDLWGAAWRSVQPALLNGLVGLVAAPFICAGAAWLPARSILRGSAIETMQPERQPDIARRGTGGGITARSLGFLALRDLQQHRARTVLSAIAVALGTAMIVASSVVKSGVRNAWASGESSMAWVADMIDVVFTSVGLIVLAAAGFLIFNAFAMAVTQQRRQIGVLRSLGMTRRQVMRQILVEALVTGGLGTLLGLAAGPLFGRGILTWIQQMDLDVGDSSVSLASIALAAATGLGVTLLSALLPARRAMHLSPLTAIREHEPADQRASESANRRIRTWAGMAMIAAMTLYLVVAPPGEWSGKNPPWEWIMWLLLWSVWIGAGWLVLPTLVSGLTRALRAPLRRFGGTVGRLIVDNLQREPRRVVLTVLTFAVGLTTIVGVGGLLAFSNDVLVMRTAEQALRQTAWFVYPFDRTTGVAQLGDFDVEALALDKAVTQETYQIAAGRAVVGEMYIVSVPELSALMPGFPSFITSLDSLTRPGGYRFTEGDWETALPIMSQAGCGLLAAPSVAARHKVGVGDTLIVQGIDGPVKCQVAGVGVGGFVPATIISPMAKGAFLPADKAPDTLSVHPLPGTDVEALEADLYAMADRHGDKAWISRPEDEIGSVFDTSDQLQGMLNGLLLLAEIAAALGMINTTLMSVAERRRELGLLRAVGATRQQVMAVITGEAALMGLIGAGLGTIAGVGLGVIFALSYGGVSFGLDLPLWEAAGETVIPALRTGWPGFLAAPVLAAAAAFPAVRAIVSGSAIETMEPARQRAARRKRASLFQRGSVRVRFTLGTGLLLVIVLAGLIGVVISHERNYLQDGTQDVLSMMIRGQATVIELSLPDDAQRLDVADMQANPFDADALLRFRALFDDVSSYGLESFFIVDSDNVVLLSLDPSEMGTLLSALEEPETAEVTSERVENEWRLYATAPIRNDDGLTIGSARMTFNMAEAQRFLEKTRNMLWAVGGAIVVVGLALSWALATPLTNAIQHPPTQSEGAPPTPAMRFFASVSLRTRLTAAMVSIVVLLVVSLELAALPLERRHVEDTLKDGIAIAVEWLGQTVSEGLSTADESLDVFEIAQDERFALDQMLEMAGTLDWARLQALAEDTRVAAMAYVALVDEDGIVTFSDQLALIGEEVGLPVETEVTDDRWRDEDVWVVSTPLRWGQDGKRVGALQMGLRRAEVETFLDESRNLFRLTGVIAVLAGVLLAQAIGGVVTAPERELAVDTRQAIQQNLDIKFDPKTRDELTLLTAAFNQMVIGLREREWLRDVFGRFVSREVAEAIRSGQVKLGGENRVVSILFCDIRGFTARSEQSTPEGMVALLNEYLPVVVEAAQRHEGTVNKFGGDSTLVIYGAPRRLQESAYQAVLTALEMRANLKRLNERLAERGEAPIRIGMGINTGVALVGAVGPEERQEYTVIGDTVTLASRIEALNKVYPEHDILVSGWTCEALGRHRAEFEFAELDQVHIRDKSESVQVWGVVKKK